MARRTNPFHYTDPSFGSGISNLIVAINGDPAAEARRAATSGSRVDTALKVAEAQNLSHLQNAINSVGALGGDGLAPNVATEILARSVGAGRSADDANDLIRGITANVGGGDSNLLRAVIGAGGSVTPNNVFSIEDREAVATRDATNDLRQATTVANISQAGQDRRFFADPANVAGNRVLAGESVSPLVGALAASEAGRKAALGAPAFAPGTGDDQGVRLTDLDTLDGEVDVLLGIQRDDAGEQVAGPAISPGTSSAIRAEADRLLRQGLSAAEALPAAIDAVGTVRLVDGPGFNDEEVMFVPYALFDDRGGALVDNFPEGFAVTQADARSPLAVAAEAGAAPAEVTTGANDVVTSGGDVIQEGETVMQGGVLYRNVGGQMVPAS